MVVILISGALFSIAQFLSINEVSTKNKGVIYKFVKNEEKFEMDEKIFTGFGSSFETKTKVPAQDIETLQDRQNVSISNSAEENLVNLKIISLNRVLKQNNEVEFFLEIYVNKPMENIKKITEDFELDLADEIEDFFDVTFKEFVNIVIEKIETFNKGLKISMSLENDSENLDLKNFFEENQKLVELISSSLNNIK